MISEDFTNYILNRAFTDDNTVNTYYVGLGKDISETDSTIVELSGNGYERVECVFAEAGEGKISNQIPLEFANTSENTWGKVKYWFLFSNSEGGEPLMQGSLSNERTIESDTILTIGVHDGVGELEFTLSDVLVQNE